ncbi:MAG: hypothetical protein J6E46_03055, partial [Faecalicoccus sp.]|nr:hypothetical protein [Faecalicoccus sp.]
MINGNLDQFLDTGWYCEATLYLDGYIYWCEGFTDFNKNVTYHFMDKWRAVNEDNLYYHSILEKDGTIHRSRV